jgi:adenine-specific DNA-methyltransferase
MTAFQERLDLGLAEELQAAGQAASVTVIDGLPRMVPAGEPKGVVYTRRWVVDLILDLAGYRPDQDLAARYVVEPSAGEGAFLVPVVRRLLASLSAHGRRLSDAEDSIRAYELDADAAARAIGLVTGELIAYGASLPEARKIAEGWVMAGDYLLAPPQDLRADLVVGNPPYIRYDDLPARALEAYRRLYPAMVGRCDIYVGFMEAGLRQLADGGVLAFICADRWMRSAYGAQLRQVISRSFAVEAVIEMHDAPAFENEVAAYPAVVVIRRAPQRAVLVASAGPEAASLPGGRSLAEALHALARQDSQTAVPGFAAASVDRWFSGTSPWPSLPPGKLAVLQRLEAQFAPLEDELTGTKIGIGVATGADRVFITTDPQVVEADRLIPLAMTADTRSGVLRWSGHYLIDPWAAGGGLVDLAGYPRLRGYLQQRKSELLRRNIAQRIPRQWYRTIDRVHHGLTSRSKLYFPDMKLASNPVLDHGGTYPHHNLYYLTSRTWDLEVLGGLLLSRVAQLFIEAYCVKMRGGTLRFQAQYLRRIRVPDPATMAPSVAARLRQAFRARDAKAATNAAIEAYGIADLATVVAC